MMSATVNGAQRVQSVARAAELLKALGGLGAPATAFELADRCGLNRSTAWRILATLEDEGLVERDPATGRYGVGLALVALGAAAGHDPLVRRARPALRALAEACGETATLAVPRRMQLVYVDQVQAPHVMAADWMGRATPVHATSTGKALLAWLSEDELGAALPDRLERFTDTTITTRAVLRTELAGVRGRGYAVSRGELEAALWGVSAPVLDGTSRPIAVVSVWGAETRIRARGLEALGARTVGAAGEIAAAVALRRSACAT
jgi:DNA-binding IclR family transcriptional regulator